MIFVSVASRTKRHSQQRRPLSARRRSKIANVTMATGQITLALVHSFASCQYQSRLRQGIAVSVRLRQLPPWPSLPAF